MTERRDTQVLALLGEVFLLLDSPEVAAVLRTQYPGLVEHVHAARRAMRAGRSSMASDTLRPS